ncbi:hypothetical protein ACHAXN_003918 [Cyclotella atomus]
MKCFTTIILSLLLASSVDAFGVGSRGLQARPDASRLVVSTKIHAAASFESSIELSYAHANTQRGKGSKLFKKAAKTAVKSIPPALTILSAIFALSSPAFAAKKATVETVEHLHVGQKIANYFRSFGLPDLAVLALISALPVIELRGAIPVGIWMGLPITTVLPICVLGNMSPIVPLMFLLRNEGLKKLMAPILSRAEKKSAALGVGSIEKQWASLAAFVGIPLPGTGAWTGAMGAFLLGMPTPVALSAIFTGVVAAGCIMTAITLAGKKGGVAALVILGLITGREFLAKEEGESDGSGI